MKKQRFDPSRMDCPCRCDCGYWYEQDDMVADPMDAYYKSYGPHKLVCKSCAKKLSAELKRELRAEKGES